MRVVIDYLPSVMLLALIFAALAGVVFKVSRRPPAKKLVGFFVGAFFAASYVFMACLILFNVTRYGIYGDASPFYGNYVPFKTIMRFIHRGNFGTITTQVIGNILITVPLPFVCRFFSRKRKMGGTCLASLAITAAIEPVQLLINLLLGGPSNIIDIDDSILNLAGCALGLLVLAVMISVRKRKEP